jgi:hypothetical protein
MIDRQKQQPERISETQHTGWAREFSLAPQGIAMVFGSPRVLEWIARYKT